MLLEAEMKKKKKKNEKQLQPTAFSVFSFQVCLDCESLRNFRVNAAESNLSSGASKEFANAAK